MALTGDNTPSTARGGQIATAILVVEAGAALMASFCPSWFTVRSPFFHEQEARQGNITSIRQGYTAAAVLTMATGWASSYMVRSPLPLIGAALITALEIGGYEYSITHPASAAKSAPPAYMSALAWPAAR